MTSTTDTRDAAKAAWNIKGRISKLPGAYRAYQYVTKQLGEGKVYKLRFGGMKGLRWRRYNSLPYWYHLGLWEPHLTDLIVAHLRPGDVFWDVGANAGYHTILASRIVGPDGHVVAFEPNPEVVAILRDELALNGVANCTIVEAAVGEVDGSVTLMRRPNNLTSALADVEDRGEPLAVAGVRLDTMLDQHRAPHLIKMDIEGGEMVALPGAEQLLSKGGSDGTRPRLLLSVHGPEAAEFCKTTLRRHGYEFHEQSGFEQMLVATPPGD